MTWAIIKARDFQKHLGSPDGNFMVNDFFMSIT